MQTLPADPVSGYRPFPDVARRNVMQATLEVPTMIRTLDLPSRGRILEIGCGRGVALPVLTRLLQPDLLIGVDIDESLLDVARDRVRTTGIAATLWNADVRALPFDDAAFDLVIDFGTCHHISQPARALREIVRVLRSGGLFACETVSSQLLSHPIRSRGRRLPWRAVPELRTVRDAILWKARRRH